MMKYILLVSILLSFLIQAEDKPNFKQYKMQEGDTISDVLKNEGLNPLYKEQNNVKKTLELNRLSSDSAKTLRPGDVILLPVETENKPGEIIYRTIDLSTLQPKKVFSGEAFLTYSIWNERIQKGSVNLKGQLNGNLGIKLASDLNHFVNVYNKKLSGFVAANVEKLKQPSVVSGQAQAVDTTYNFSLSGGLYIEPEWLQARTFMAWQYEQFEGFDVAQNLINRRRNKISWFGVGLKHTFFLWEHAFNVKPSLMGTVLSSSELANGKEVDGVTGYKAMLEMTFDLDPKWKVATQIGHYSFKEFDDYNLTNYAVSFGRSI